MSARTPYRPRWPPVSARVNRSGDRAAPAWTRTARRGAPTEPHGIPACAPDQVARSQRNRMVPTSPNTRVTPSRTRADAQGHEVPSQEARTSSARWCTGENHRGAHAVRQHLRRDEGAGGEHEDDHQPVADAGRCGDAGVDGRECVADREHGDEPERQGQDREDRLLGPSDAEDEDPEQQGEDSAGQAEDEVDGQVGRGQGLGELTVAAHLTHRPACVARSARGRRPRAWLP